METDKLFYQILLLFPGLLGELTDLDPIYRFKFSSPTVKALERRLDGLLLPESDDPTHPLVFVEAQMQPDSNLYRRILSQLSIYLVQYDVVNPWKTVVIYPTRQTERLAQPQVIEALNLTRVFLNELEGNDSEGLDCLQLIGAEPEEVPTRAASLVERVKGNAQLGNFQGEIIELISSIVTRKFPQLSEKEIKQMLNLTPLEQTKPFQEGLQQGRQEGLQQGLQQGQQEKAREIARNLLHEGMTPEIVARASGLSLEEIQSLEST